MNAGPDFNKSASYQIVRDYMRNSIEDIYVEWLRPRWGTYANELNTWSNGSGDPIIYDYIFHRSMNETKVQMCTSSYQMPILKTPVGDKNVSLSDHEAISASFAINQKKSRP